MTTRRVVWSAAEAGRLRHFALDPLVAIYDRGSGQTHILAEPLPQLLALLSISSGDIQALATRLRADHIIGDEGGDANEQMVARIEECLHQLAAMGLVTAHPVTT